MHAGQKFYNSNGSDNNVIVWPQGVDVPDTRVDLIPGGDSYKVLKEDVNQLKIYVEASRFRVKKNGGSWEGWQVLPSGEKTFSPADTDTTYFQTDLS
jgi:hypothetical protein